MFLISHIFVTSSTTVCIRGFLASDPMNVVDTDSSSQENLSGGGQEWEYFESRYRLKRLCEEAITQASSTDVQARLENLHSRLGTSHEQVEDFSHARELALKLINNAAANRISNELERRLKEVK